MLSEKKAVNALKPWWDVAFQVTITALIVLGKKKLNLTYYCVKLKIFDITEAFLEGGTDFVSLLTLARMRPRCRSVGKFPI